MFSKSNLSSIAFTLGLIALSVSSQAKAAGGALKCFDLEVQSGAQAAQELQSAISANCDASKPFSTSAYTVYANVVYTVCCTTK